MNADWFFDERAHAGAEHLDHDQVAAYDEKSPFDPSEEIKLLKSHGLSEEDTVIDLGCGTGAFVVAVAPHCDRVIGVDISDTMLNEARNKIETAGVTNVELVHDGVLTYEHEGASASFVFSKNTLHHLPDFWKVEALKAVGAMLHDGGIFRLRDLVYSFDPNESHEAIDTWLEGMESSLFTTEELHHHVRGEFSTYGYLLESMLERTRFEILEATYRDGFYASYTCKWTANP